MKLVRFTENNTTRLGKLAGGQVIDLSSITGPGNSMRALLTRLPELRAALEAASSPSFALADVKLEAPINDPQKYLAIGMNYRKHIVEAQAAGVAVPTSQFWFNKQVSCITGPSDPIEMPKVSDKVDYEGELGVIIGTQCRHVKAADARAAIAGYVICNDISVRDWQMRSPTFTLGKSFDTHGPIGPYITTDDEIADPLDLELSVTVNGEERQRTSTGDMVYNIYDQIEYLSTVMTLYPGDILATGTPSGVGAAKGLYLKAGDVVRVEIQNLGFIENKLEDEV